MLVSLVIVWHVVGRFSHSPRDGLSRHHSARGGKILLIARARLTHRRSACGGEILFLAPCRLSRHRPACGKEILLLAECRLSCRRSARGGEILLLAPCWCPSSSFGAWWGDSLTHRVLDSFVIVLEAVLSFAGWGVSLTRPVLKFICSFVG